MSSPSAHFTARRPLNPPVGISHTTESVEDLYAHRLSRGQRVILHPAAQPNSFPHLGSVTTLCATFAMAKHLERVLGVLPEILFWELENAPASITDINGAAYFRALGHSEVGGELLSERHLQSFRWLLHTLQEVSGISVQRYSYGEFQSRWDARWAVLRILDAQDRLAPLLCPTQQQFKVRFPCPECRLMAKAGGTLVDIDPTSRSRTYRNRCPEHGDHLGLLAAGNDQWFDTNTPVRALAREMIYTENYQRTGTHNLMADGSDWAHYAPINIESLGQLGLPIPDLPMRFFAPVVLDWSGAKLAKSAQVGSDAYADTPQFYVNFEELRRTFGDGIVDLLWEEAQRWVSSPKRLFRSYTIGYMESVLNASGKHVLGGSSR